MLRVALFLGGDLSYFQSDFDLFVGVDRGCLSLLREGLPLHWAVGDFDSVSGAELEQIEQKAERLIKAPAEKNDTDTELALVTIFQTYPQAQVTIFGSFGGRLDHSLNNVFLPSHPDLTAYAEQITLRDGQNEISYRLAGHHEVTKNDEMAYISFMVEGQGSLSIAGAKYPLNASNFFQRKIYTSNEFTRQPLTIDLDSGYVAIIQTKDRR